MLSVCDSLVVPLLHNRPVSVWVEQCVFSPGTDMSSSASSDEPQQCTDDNWVKSGVGMAAGSNAASDGLRHSYSHRDGTLFTVGTEICSDINGTQMFAQSRVGHKYLITSRLITI